MVPLTSPKKRKKKKHPALKSRCSENVLNYRKTLKSFWVIEVSKQQQQSKELSHCVQRFVKASWPKAAGRAAPRPLIREHTTFQSHPFAQFMNILIDCMKTLFQWPSAVQLWLGDGRTTAKQQQQPRAWSSNLAAVLIAKNDNCDELGKCVYWA